VQVCLRVGADRVEGKWMWSDGVGGGQRMERRRRGRGERQKRMEKERREVIP